MKHDLHWNIMCKQMKYNSLVPSYKCSQYFHVSQIGIKDTRDQFKACCESKIKHAAYAR